MERASLTHTTKRWSLSALTLTFLLTACGGSGDPVIPETNNPNDPNNPANPSNPGATSSVTYFPLNTYLKGDNYLGEGTEAFAGIMFNPLIKAYVIAPVDAQTLEPASANISDYSITMNDQVIDSAEQYAMLQRIVGLPNQLNTALVIDTGGRSQAVNRQALINELKAYISAVQSHPDPVVKNQQFTILAYGDEVSAVQPTLTASAETLNSALDSVLTNWETLGQGTSTYEAIVTAIGTYTGTSPADSAQEYELGNDGIDDLLDGYQQSATDLSLFRLSSVVLVSAGGASNNIFTAESVREALEWQSYVVYDTEAESEAAEPDTNENVSENDNTVIPDSAITYLGKPLLYVRVGDGQPNAALQNMAAASIDGRNYSFANELITAQLNAIAIRTKEDNRHLVRFAVRERDGNHTILFRSQSRGFNYALVTELDLKAIYEASQDLDTPVAPPPQVAPLVEITNASNDYFAAGRIRRVDATRLFPATRFTVKAYSASSDYSWTIGGVVRNPNADGSVTISAADVGNSIVLTNTVENVSVTMTIE